MYSKIQSSFATRAFSMNNSNIHKYINITISISKHSIHTLTIHSQYIRLTIHINSISVLWKYGDTKADSDPTVAVKLFSGRLQLDHIERFLSQIRQVCSLYQTTSVFQNACLRLKNSRTILLDWNVIGSSLYSLFKEML